VRAALLISLVALVLGASPAAAAVPPGGRLPSGLACAERLARDPWEPRAGNRSANRTRGARLRLPASAWHGFDGWRRLARRVSGGFTGRTDEIIRWASCKWGFSAELTRAQAYVESGWDQRFRGDRGASVGLMQVKAGRPGTPHRYTWPHARTSTAYNLDYALAWRRACYEGLFAAGGWLPARSRGDLWGCVGLWFSGRWHAGSTAYVRAVRRALRERPWAR
jgi:hypothetical protein